MLKRSFYFTLFFLGCCGETQAMKKVTSTQTLTVEQPLVTRMLLKTSAGGTPLNVINDPSRLMGGPRPEPVKMLDEVDPLLKAAPAQGSNADKQDKAVGNEQNVVVAVGVNNVVIAQLVIAAAAQEEELVFPGYIKKMTTAPKSETTPVSAPLFANAYSCIPSAASCTCCGNK